MPSVKAFTPCLAAVYAGPPSTHGYQESDAKDVKDLAHAYAKTKREGEILLENKANKINQETKGGVIYISLRYFKSLSPSRISASEEASKLKFFA